MFRIAVLSVAVLLAGNPAASVGKPSEGCPPEFAGEEAAPDTLSFNPADTVHVGSFKLRFGKIPLPVIAQALGAGTVRRQDAAHAGVYWLCYTLPGPTHPRRLWLGSDSEMGGSEHDLTEVWLSDAAPPATPALCPTLPVALSSVRFTAPVALGQSREEVVKRLGPPSAKFGDVVQYGYGASARDRQGQEWWTGATLQLRFAQGRVAEIGLLQVTSN